jgi:integrase
MGSKWFTGGVVAAPHGRIQFDFTFEGVRYRPSIRRPPSEANLRRARKRLNDIKRQIEVGAFSFAEEFSDYRLFRRVGGTVRVRSCGEVFDEFLAHCEAGLARHDLASSTASAYRRVLNGVWRPTLGRQLFHKIRYSQLVAIADRKPWSKKTYNNAISILRRAFEFDYRNHPEQHNPARSLRSARLKKKDRPKIDPFCMQDAETFVAAIHRDWGEAQGNYDEFRFFTGLRPSEQIALVLSDLDLVNGIISVNKARVAGVERSQTKTGEDRRVALCPRASAILKRQLTLHGRLRAAGLVQHDHVFFRETGEPFWNLQIQGKRWRKTLTSLNVRYRRPYTARHSSVSWNLLADKNPLWVAKQHGHSICTMLRVYAACADGAVESEIDAIKRSMNPRARLSSTTKSTFPAAHRLPCSRPTHPLVECLNRMRQLQGNANLAVDLPVQAGAKTQVLDNRWERMAEREGFEPSKGF